MANKADLEKKLDSLTERQCLIVYWLCQGRQRAWIAEKIGGSEDTVKRDIGLIYEKLELDYSNRTERRFTLANSIAPIYIRRVEESKTGCKKAQAVERPPEPLLDANGKQILVIEPQPKPETEGMVDVDEELERRSSNRYFSIDFCGGVWSAISCDSIEEEVAHAPHFMESASRTIQCRKHNH